MTVSAAEWRAELLRLLEVDRTPATDIIAATREIQPPWPTYDFPKVPPWSRGRMIIIEDAVTLGKCFRDIDIPEAFAAYERSRRQRVEAVVAQGKRNGDGKFKKSSGTDDPNRWMWERHVDWKTPVGGQPKESQNPH
jgi:hypothetical protein